MTIVNEAIEIDECPNCGHNEYVMPRGDVAICDNCKMEYEVVLHVPGASYDCHWYDAMIRAQKAVFAKNISVPPSLVINRIKD